MPSKSRAGFRIALCLALFFGVAEIGARHYARRRENQVADATDFTSIPARAARLSAQKGLKITFVGNSAVQEGIDIPLFERAMQRQISPRNALAVHATMSAAQASQIKDWRWMLENYYWRPHRQCDLYVVLFFSDYLQDKPLEDQDRGRLAQFFTSPRDWPTVWRDDLTTGGERAEFLFSYASMLYAMRAVTREKLLRLSAPGYEKHLIQLNDIQRKQLEQSAADKSKTLKSNRPTYRALKDLLARARKNHAKLCFVAYPRNGEKYSYIVSPEVIALIKNAGMSYLDLRPNSPLTSDDYRDSIHVNKKGRTSFTKYLAQELALLLPKK